ncbi:hypothetical protein LguiA_002783 [Lonicera macranthoides]
MDSPHGASSYWDLPEEHLQNVYNHISTYYNVSHDNVKMFTYIQKVAYVQFNQWMSDCKAHFETFGPYIPVEFVERVDEWTWLIAHWSTEESKVRSKRRKEVKASKKVDHSSGSTPFAYRANKLKEFGNKAPILNTLVEGYKKSAPKAAVAMTVAVEASITSFKALNPTPPPMERGSNLTPLELISLSVEKYSSIV